MARYNLQPHPAALVNPFREDLCDRELDSSRECRKIYISVYICTHRYRLFRVLQIRAPATTGRNSVGRIIRRFLSTFIIIIILYLFIFIFYAENAVQFKILDDEVFGSKRQLTCEVQRKVNRCGIFWFTVRCGAIKLFDRTAPYRNVLTAAV